MTSSIIVLTPVVMPSVRCVMFVFSKQIPRNFLIFSKRCYCESETYLVDLCDWFVISLINELDYPHRPILGIEECADHEVADISCRA